MYKYLRIAVIILLIWGIIGTVFSFSSVSGDDPEGERRRALADNAKDTQEASTMGLGGREMLTEVATTKAKDPVRLLNSLSSVSRAGSSAPANDGGRRDCVCL